MVSWDIMLGLMVMTFILPFIFLLNLITSTRRRASEEHNEVKQLRSMLAELSEHVQRDQSLILEALGIPFLLMRPSGRVIMANRKAATLFGMPSMNNVNLLRLMPDNELKQFALKAVNSTEKVRAMISVSRPDGEHIYRATATHLDTREHHIGIVFLDMTEEHRTQVIRRDFIANASHELRTPLTLILGYLETLLDSPEAADDADMRQRSLEIMKRHADRMARLVSDMLMLSRVESPGASYMKQESFDLHQLAQEAVLRLEAQASSQGAEITMSVSPQPCMMEGDSFYWSQVLFNLLENALKNNPSPGLRVQLTAEPAADGCLRICVEDNGIGISPNALPYIFNRFYRADQTGKVKGTGLGLAIVKHAVEAHGGSIRAESAPGVRTAFIITQPREMIND